jgi:hypothetical protein
MGLRDWRNLFRKRTSPQPQTALLVAAMAAFVAACDAAPTAGNSTAEDSAQSGRELLKGYGSLKFGSTLMEALADTGTERFNAYGVKECLDDLPLQGCFLSPASDAAPYLIEAGIPYRLGLEFNKFDKLTDIRLSYDREGKITFDECLSLHERTLDWLTQRYGQLRSTLNDKEKLEQRRTPAGNQYLLWRSKDGSFVTSFMRTAPPTLPASVQRKPIPQWDNERYLHLLSHYIVVDGKPMCTIGLEFSEPQSVERRPQTKETNESAEEPKAEGTSEALGEPMHGPYIDEEVDSLDGNDQQTDHPDE